MVDFVMSDSSGIGKGSASPTQEVWFLVSLNMYCFRSVIVMMPCL